MYSTKKMNKKKQDKLFRAHQDFTMATSPSPHARTEHQKIVHYSTDYRKFPPIKTVVRMELLKGRECG